MEKRLILAVLLMSATILLTNLLFPPPEPVEVEPEAAVEAPTADPALAPAPVLRVPEVRAEAAAGDSVVVESELYRYVFSTRGAALLRADMLAYPSYTEEGPVQLVPAGETSFLAHRLVVGGDTLDLRALPFRPSASSVRLEEDGAPQQLRFEYAGAEGFAIALVYTFRPERYLVEVQGQVSGLGGRPATLLTELGPGLAPHEAFEHRSEQQLAVVTRSPGDIERLPLRKLEGEQAIAQPLTWAGIKDKYFLAAVIAGEQTPFAGAAVRAVPAEELLYPDRDEPVEVPQGRVVTSLPVGADGAFALQAYLGPQEFDRLSGVGYDLENVTQYAYRWLEPVIRPVAAAVMWVLERLHNALGLAYGWVLVLFGVMMRVVLWPLNTKAMRAQMKNMAVQPLMQEIREKYKSDPQKQQEELIKLYKEHGFNPFAGCLPLLIPFPVLITLFFVFQNTIAFRGAEFLWLPDLSLADPIYLLPVVLMVSMFGLQWVSAHLSGMEQNPQMKMMMYFMPLMMGVIFFNLPAGLNLYYATTNVASIPQQVLIARERRKARNDLAPAAATQTPASARGPSRPPRRAKGKK